MPELNWEIAAGGHKQFEVASVRENTSDEGGGTNFSLDNGNSYRILSKDDSLDPSGNLFSARNQPLFRYIVLAYKLNGTQELALRFTFFKGLETPVPNWVKNTRFDIEARTSGPATKDQMRLMMQSLLAERFKLILHMEKREAPVFAMALARPATLGPQLRQHPAGDDCASTAFSSGPDDSASHSKADSEIPIPCGMIAHLPPLSPGDQRFAGRNVPLSLLASSLPTQTGMIVLPRPVVDRTGLTGAYDFSIEWAPGDTREIDNQESGSPFWTALKDQLGFKLERVKAPVEVLVIDHIEPPSPN